MRINLNSLKILLVLLPVFFSFSLTAQQFKEDVVYLNNGGIIRGVIIEYFPDQYVKIETVGGNIWVFQAAEIMKITKEEAYKSAKKEFKAFTSGYFNHTDFGILVGGGSNYYYYYTPVNGSLLTVNGYKFKNKISTGIGLGLDFVGYPSFPLFGDLRYEFTNKRFTPLAIIQAGYTFMLDGKVEEDWQRDYKGGYFTNVMFGLRTSLNNNNSVVICVGYRNQNQVSSYTNPNINTEITHIDYFNRFVFRIGFQFN